MAEHPDIESRDNILAVYGTIAEITTGTYKVDVEQTFTDGRGTVVVAHRQTGECKGSDSGTAKRSSSRSSVGRSCR